jgi:hypothetical protein
MRFDWEKTVDRCAGVKFQLDRVRLPCTVETKSTGMSFGGVGTIRLFRRDQDKSASTLSCLLPDPGFPPVAVLQCPKARRFYLDLLAVLHQGA